MSLIITIPQTVIYYTEEQYCKWVNGDREDCPDGYCKNLRNSYGFGEFIAGRYFAAQGYSWIHHDYNIFGGNRLGKYPMAEEVLKEYFGENKFMALRGLKYFKYFQEPDLMIYKPDYSEIRFAECKRLNTRDKLGYEQMRGLSIIAALLECKVDLLLIAKENTKNPEALSFEIPGNKVLPKL